MGAVFHNQFETVERQYSFRCLEYRRTGHLNFYARVDGLTSLHQGFDGGDLSKKA